MHAHHRGSVAVAFVKPVSLLASQVSYCQGNVLSARAKGETWAGSR
jgi:hypothetical protein